MFGLIGYPLSHSFSKEYFSQKFKKEGPDNHSYENFEVASIEELKSLIQNHPKLAGLNVTIPYKQQVLGMLDHIDPKAAKAGAVNCIKIDRSGESPKLFGYNTDIYGFEKSIKPFLRLHHEKAIILGTGGSSKAIAYVLKKMGLEYLFISRTPSDCNQIRYTVLNQSILEEHTIIINTTPLGMFPHIESFPLIPYEYVTKQHLLFDLIYNPEKTAFLRKGEERGATIKNGFEMLQLQAEESWQIWNR